MCDERLSRLDGNIHFILLNGVGGAFVRGDIDRQPVLDTLVELGATVGV